MYIYICIYIVCICYIYVYIYIERERAYIISRTPLKVCQKPWLLAKAPGGTALGAGLRGSSLHTCACARLTAPYRTALLQGFKLLLKACAGPF